MARQEPLVERAIDKFKPQPAPPPNPKPPRVPEKEWQDSVERKQVVPGLTVRDIGLSIYGETRSLHDRSSSNESIGVARQKIAHAMINDAELSHRIGKPRNKVHDPIEPSTQTKLNLDERAALDSSMQAAREAYLSGHDPTQGATHFNMRPTPSRSSWKNVNPIATHSGPYDNSFPNKNAPRHTTWINTYLPDEKGN